MQLTIEKYKKALQIVFLTAFFIIPLDLFSQADTIFFLPLGLESEIIDETDQTRNFFDSLKERASRRNFTRRLYDFVIVTPENHDYAEIENVSYEIYLPYSGRKIRSIEIQRLNVFGTDINNPTVTSANRTANFLNKTHIVTAESAIRNNLLFKTGDAISPLVLSDNERILRELAYIDDARIFVVPISDDEADIVVVTKDVYSIGLNYNYQGFKRGNATIFDKNILGLGHLVEFNIPFDFETSSHIGFGFNYSINNIRRSFIDFKAFYINGIGVNSPFANSDVSHFLKKESRQSHWIGNPYRIKAHGISLNRSLVSYTTKYAGGISFSKMETKEDLDTMTVASPLNYTLQDYWVARSFLLNSESVQRIIIGARYYNNNIFERPFIYEDSYHDLQKHKVFLGSIAYSRQKYYKTNLIYAYGRAEDVPFGALVRITSGKEIGEFRNRFYLGFDASTGRSIGRLGYFHAGMAIGGYMYKNEPEQGVISANVNYFSNLITAGKYRIRNFVNLNYTRGVDRFSDEYLNFVSENGFAGFRNDTIMGSQRFSVDIESALFTPSEFLGFRSVIYAFADMGLLTGTNVFASQNFSLAAIGLGLRVRNDNLLFRTIHIRFAYFPRKPEFSRIDNIVVSGGQLLQHQNFVPERPAVIQYR
jgi:hypothetical protein